MVWLSAIQILSWSYGSFFEANPNLVKLLSKSVLVNGLAMRSTINHYAVSSAPGKSLTLEIPKLHKGSASTCGFNVDLSLFHESSDNIERLTVQSISIDSFCTQNSIHSVAFIKIDVEGGEEQVLLGCEKTIRSSQSLVVMMEWNKNRYSDNLRRILRLFTWCGGIDQARSWNDLSTELQEAKTIKHFEEMVSARIGKESGHFDLFFGIKEADMSLAASVSTG